MAFCKCRGDGKKVGALQASRNIREVEGAGLPCPWRLIASWHDCASSTKRKQWSPDFPMRNSLCEQPLVIAMNTAAWPSNYCTTPNDRMQTYLGLRRTATTGRSRDRDPKKSKTQSQWQPSKPGYSNGCRLIEQASVVVQTRKQLCSFIFLLDSFG